MSGFLKYVLGFQPKRPRHARDSRISSRISSGSSPAESSSRPLSQCERPFPKSLFEHQAQQAAYQMAAKLIGNAITDPNERRRLREANQAMFETRRFLLPYGRGDVAADLEPSAGRNYAGTVATKNVARMTGNQEAELGMALAMGAGNAKHHASLLALRHSAELASGETIRSVVNSTDRKTDRRRGHARAEISAPAKDGVRPSVIVADAWANGPAVRYEDSAGTRNVERASVVFETDKYLASDLMSKAVKKSQNVHDLYDSGRVLPPGTDELRGTLPSEVYRDLAEGDGPKVIKFVPEEQTVDRKLAKAARRKLDGMNGLNSEIEIAGEAREAYGNAVKEMMAAGAAREAYGYSVYDATRPHNTEAVLSQVRRLDQQERSPRVRSPKLNPLAKPIEPEGL